MAGRGTEGCREGGQPCSERHRSAFWAPGEGRRRASLLDTPPRSPTGRQVHRRSAPALQLWAAGHHALFSHLVPRRAAALLFAGASPPFPWQLSAARNTVPFLNLTQSTAFPRISGALASPSSRKPGPGGTGLTAQELPLRGSVSSKAAGSSRRPPQAERKVPSVGVGDVGLAQTVSSLSEAGRVHLPGSRGVQEGLWP